MAFADSIDLHFCSGRYNHFAKLLNDQGLKVYAMDWIGELLSHISAQVLIWYDLCIALSGLTKTM